MSGTGQVTVARLRELGIRPDTRLGQHFLVDDNLVRVALRLAALRADDVALEIGAGLGVLTVALADACRHVHAVEIDRRLEEALLASLGTRTNVDVHWADALRLDPAALAPAPTVLVANLPYNVATPVVMESLAGLPGIDRWCVMVQKEIAERFFAGPADDGYGAVSVLVGLACVRTGSHPVSRRVFAPPPNVDSTLVAFARRPGDPAAGVGWPRLVQIVQGAFAHRRKTLANSLALAGVATRPEAEAALAAVGRAGSVRAESLPPEAFPALAEHLER